MRDAPRLRSPVAQKVAIAQRDPWYPARMSLGLQHIAQPQQSTLVVFSAENPLRSASDSATSAECLSTQIATFGSRLPPIALRHSCDTVR